MKIRFTANGSDHDRDLRSFYTWLRDDRTLRGLVELEPFDLQTRPGDMGGVFDAVVAVVSSGAAAGQLAISIREWRRARQPRSVIVVVVDGAEGGGKDNGAVGAAAPIIDALSDPEPDE